MRRVLIIVGMAVLLSSCVYVDTRESLRQGEIRLVYPAGSPPMRKQTFHLPTHCRKYLDDGTRRWAECMQVGYK